MKKLKIFLLGIVAFILSSCYTTIDTTQPPATYEVYQSYPYETSVYLIYNYTCMSCYYDMYPYWDTWHVRVTHFCSYHYNWYYNWYRPHHNNWYLDYKYYYNHYKYRDRSRHFIRNNQGYRNYNDRDGTKVKEVRPPVKRNETIDRKPPVKRNETIDRKPSVKRNETYKQPKVNSKPPVKKNTTRSKDRK